MKRVYINLTFVDEDDTPEYSRTALVSSSESNRIKFNEELRKEFAALVHQVTTVREREQQDNDSRGGSGRK